MATIKWSAFTNGGALRTGDKLVGLRAGVNVQFDPNGIGSIVWNDVAGTTQTAVINNGYVISNAAQTTITLPTTCAEGSVFAIAGKGAAGWILKMAAGQTCHIGSSASSVAGTITSTNQYDSLTIVCVTANTTFVAIAGWGNLTPA